MFSELVTLVCTVAICTVCITTTVIHSRRLPPSSHSAPNDDMYFSLTYLQVMCTMFNINKENNNGGHIDGYIKTIAKL